MSAVRGLDLGRPRATGGLGDWAVVAGPATLALVLCLVGLGGRSLWLDEATSIAIASAHGGALGSAIAHDGGNMSGYYALLHLLVSAFGKGLWVVRAPSAAGIALGAGATAWVGLWLFGRRVALVSGVFCAVSLPLVFWGQNARGYGLMTGLVALSYLGVCAGALRGGGWRAWGAYAVITVLALYMSYVALLAVAAQLVFLAVWRREAWRPFAVALVAVAAACVPLLVLALQRGSGQLFWVPRPDATAIKQVLEAVTSAGLEPNFHATAALWPLLGVSLLAVLGALVWVGSGSLAVARWRSFAPRRELGMALVLAWALLPVVVALVESLVGQPLFLPRNLLSAVPGVALALGWVVARPGLAPWVCWPLVAALTALRAVALVPSYDVSPEDWKAATGFVTTHARPGDCIAFYPADGRMAFRYYLRGFASAPRPVLPAAPWRANRVYVEDYATLSAVPSGCARTWLVASHQGQSSGPALTRAHYAGYLALRARLGAAYRGSSVTRFGYAAVVRVELSYGRRVMPTKVRALRPASSTPLAASRTP